MFIEVSLQTEEVINKYKVLIINRQWISGYKVWDKIILPLENVFT